MLFLYKGEAGAVVAVTVYGFCPHGSGPHPKSTVTIQGLVDHHRLQCFAMGGNADKLIFLAFKMAIFAKL